MKLEDLLPNIAVRGILPESLVTVVSVRWYGDNALELTYKDAAGRVSQMCPRLARQITQP